MSEMITADGHAAGPALAPSRNARLRRLAIRWAAGLALLALVAEAGVRVALGNAFMSPPVFQPMAGVPSYGLIPSVSSSVWQFGRTLNVSTDPFGHRNTPGAPLAAPVTLHLVGDSQVFGWGLSDDETLSAHLQQRLGPGVRVVNHGVPGYGPDEYRAALKAIPTSELVVVVSTEENDGGDAYRLVPTVNVACGFVSGFDHDGPLQCALMRSRLVQGIAVGMNALDHHYHMTPLGFSEHSQVAGRVIHARIAQWLGDAAAQRTGRTLFTVVPWKGRFSANWRALYAPPPIAEARTLPTPFPESLDTVRRFAARADAESLYFDGDTHLSPAGANFLADLIAAGFQTPAGPSLRPEQQ